MKQFSKESYIYDIAQEATWDFLDNFCDSSLMYEYTNIESVIVENIDMIINKYVPFDDCTINDIIAHNMRYIIDLFDDNDKTIRILYNNPPINIYEFIVRAYIKHFADDIGVEWITDNE